MPALELPNCLFLHTDSYLLDCRYIDAPPGQSQTENYTLDERFTSRVSMEREPLFSRYGGSEDAYNHQAGETALALSRVLWACGGNLDNLAGQFDLYWQGRDEIARPHGLYARDLALQHNLSKVLWTHTATKCERFFSYLAVHRHLIARNANPDDEPKAAPFGRNRYHDYLTAQTNEERAKLLSYLETDLKNPPYNVSLQRFYDQGGKDVPSRFIIRDIHGTVCPFGCLTKGVLVNWMTPPDCYNTVFGHMEDLFLAITGPELPDVRTFLEKVFELQYWYIHVMPCERGSLAVMNMFRCTMLAYYNRRQPDQSRWLPLAPNRTGIYPDLEALFLRGSMATFIEASIQDLYCANYSVFCNG